MKTFDFSIHVNFFHGKLSKVAELKNFTYEEAFSVYQNLKFKYANDNFPFKDIVMFWNQDNELRTVVQLLNSEFLDSDDDFIN